MFERNIMTFNPGWTHKQETLKDFQDARELQRTLKGRDIELKSEADEATDGPVSFQLIDPDGNPILVDRKRPEPQPGVWLRRVAQVAGMVPWRADAIHRTWRPTTTTCWRSKKTGA
jgi:hypothetical protein